ncbi:hypothetical protein BgAZ_100770 [Babesia gibsoni]|uniref:Uncharacterized protein n=1 Tax=Babesia gibsoni TaxID=33632 RepID=A0AAD8PF15_BABGI|nr:hypothetical protein BgAZ_100770 [Babesia gibsoni]
MEKPLADITQEIRALAKKNKFKEIIKFLSDLAYKYEKSPRRLIAVLTMRIFYNMQINANQNIVSDFNLIKSPYSEKWMYESYPDKYGEKKGSMCPFSLYLLYAYYPYLVGSTYTALDRFYTLWNHLEQTHGEHSEANEVFESRIACVALLIADIFVSEQRPLDALSILLKVNRQHGINNHAVSAMTAVLYSMIGDNHNSSKYMGKAIEEETPFKDYYRAIQCMLVGDFENARDHLTTCKNCCEEQETSTAVSSYESMIINNIAVSLFYLNHTVAAKVTVEGCSNVYKSAKLFKGVVWNSTMLKELVVDIDSSFLEGAEA